MRLVEVPHLTLACFMSSMSSGNHAGATDVFGRFIQAFRTITRM